MSLQADVNSVTAAGIIFYAGMGSAEPNGEVNFLREYRVMPIRMRRGDIGQWTMDIGHIGRISKERFILV